MDSLDADDNDHDDDGRCQQTYEFIGEDYLPAEQPSFEMAKPIADDNVLAKK